MTSATETKQLQQEIQNELITANQLTQQILNELQQIKSLTDPGKELEATVKQNGILASKLVKLRNIDEKNLPSVRRNYTNKNSQNTNRETTEEPNESDMAENE